MNPNPYVSPSFTPLAANQTAYLNGVTGAGPTFVVATPAAITDGMGHRASLTSTANLSAVNVTINGTDLAGNAISETIAGPNVNTVATTKHFLTVTSVSISATLGINTMSAGFGASAVTPWVPIDYRQNSFAVSQGVGLVSGTINYDLERMYEPATLSETSIPFTTLAAQTTTKDAQLVAPVVAVRVHVNSSTSAVFKHYVVQGERA